MNLLVQALYAKFAANKTKAMAELSILLNNPVGISEHTDIVHECEQKIKEISEAEENINTLKNITTNGDSPSEN